MKKEVIAPIHAWWITAIIKTLHLATYVRMYSSFKELLKQIHGLHSATFLLLDWFYNALQL